MTSAAA